MRHGMVTVMTLVLAALVLMAAQPSAALAATLDGSHLELVSNGASDYVIVVAKGASESEKFAAAELANHFQQMSGAVLKIETESDKVPEKAIIIGDGPAAQAAGVKIDAEKLSTDGYTMKVSGTKLVIAGGRQRGTLYGVYDLLAELGCRWWAPGASTIPQMKTIAVATLDKTKIPAATKKRLELLWARYV